MFLGRYIDDILLIWRGPHLILKNFILHCNNNSFRLQFSFESHSKTMVFLDVELTYGQNAGIVTRTHFKPAAGNSYQFCHLTRNCTLLDDYIQRSRILNKFQEKGYNKREKKLTKNTFIIRGKLECRNLLC